MLIKKFNSIDEIHKIWNDETFIRYHQIKRQMLRANINLTTEQEEKLFPDIPDYAIIDDKVYKLEEYSHLELTPFKNVDTSSYYEIELEQIDDVEKINAASCYVELTKRCELAAVNPKYPEAVKHQFEKELIRLHKQFLENTPKEFLRLQNFEIIEK